MVEQIIPLEHVADVLRVPVVVVNGDRYFVVAQGWAPEDLAMIDIDDDAFGYAMVRIDTAGRGLPQEYDKLPTFH